MQNMSNNLYDLNVVALCNDLQFSCNICHGCLKSNISSKITEKPYFSCVKIRLLYFLETIHCNDSKKKSDEGVISV